MTRYLVYIHPSVAPAGIKVETWYSLEELQARFNLDYIKAFFTPANFGWEETEEIKKNK